MEIFQEDIAAINVCPHYLLPLLKTLVVEDIPSLTLLHVRKMIINIDF